MSEQVLVEPATSGDSCQAGAIRLEGSDLEERVAKLPGWQVSDGRLRRSIEFSSFSRAYAFATQIALLAMRDHHHPTITVDKRDVELVLWTRKQSAITTLDTDQAEAIEVLLEQYA